MRDLHERRSLDAAESIGHKLSASAVSYTEEGEEAHFDVYWRASQQDTELPNYIAELARRSGVKKLHRDSGSEGLSKWRVTVL